MLLAQKQKAQSLLITGATDNTPDLSVFDMEHSWLDWEKIRLLSTYGQR